MQVVKTVYASPSRVNFHLDSKKASIVAFLIPMFVLLEFVFDVSIVVYLGSGNNTCLPRNLFCRR